MNLKKHLSLTLAVTILCSSAAKLQPQSKAMFSPSYSSAQSDTISSFGSTLTCTRVNQNVFELTLRKSNGEINSARFTAKPNFNLRPFLNEAQRALDAYRQDFDLYFFLINKFNYLNLDYQNVDNNEIQSPTENSRIVNNTGIICCTQDSPNTYTMYVKTNVTSTYIINFTSTIPNFQLRLLLNKAADQLNRNKGDFDIERFFATQSSCVTVTDIYAGPIPISSFINPAPVVAQPVASDSSASSFNPSAFGAHSTVPAPAVRPATSQITFDDLTARLGIDRRLFPTDFCPRMANLNEFYEGSSIRDDVKDLVRPLPEVQIEDTVNLDGSKRNTNPHQCIIAHENSIFVDTALIPELFSDYYNMIISASQFNCLESTRSDWHASLPDYSRDHSQGPSVCALSLLSCLKRESQYEEGTLGDLVQNSLSDNIKAKAYEGGYLMPYQLEDSEIRELILQLLRNPAKYGYQDEVFDAQSDKQYEKDFRQIFCSAVSYQDARRDNNRNYQYTISYVALRNQYLNALRDAINEARKDPNRQVALHVACVGGGFFGNPNGTAQLAFLNAYNQLQDEIDGNLTIFLHGGLRFWKDISDDVNTCIRNINSETEGILGDPSSLPGFTIADMGRLRQLQTELRRIDVDALMHRFTLQNFSK